jgi:NAD(P)-dependent dehydrogenase (short-subunit alcohol dehydrogenase family)
VSASLTNWTAASISDLADCKAIVTGANSGIGFHTALELARNGANVTLAVRNESKGQAAAERIRREVPGAIVNVALIDLADLASVHAFADKYLANNIALNVLINNAGIMAIPVRQLTADGFEMQIGAMHFGHYALTGRLWPALAKAGKARVVTVASIAHKLGRMDFENLDGQKHYSPNTIYSQAKLANLLFGMELHRRCTAARIAVRSVIAHPGITATNLQTTGAHTAGTPSFSARMLEKFAPKLFQQGNRGAIPSLYAATAVDADSGCYYGPSGFLEIGGAHPKRAVIAKQGLDRVAAKRLWEISEARTSVRFL